MQKFQCDYVPTNKIVVRDKYMSMFRLMVSTPIGRYVIIAVSGYVTTKIEINNSIDYFDGIDTLYDKIGVK